MITQQRVHFGVTKPLIAVHIILNSFSWFTFTLGKIVIQCNASILAKCEDWCLLA